jgi:hypothetical protein
MTLNLTKAQKQVLSVALEIFEYNGDDSFGSVRNNPEQYKAFKELQSAANNRMEPIELQPDSEPKARRFYVNKAQISFKTIDGKEIILEVFDWLLFFSKGRWIIGIQKNEKDSNVPCFEISRQEYNRLWEIKMEENKKDKCSFCDGKGFKVNQYSCPSCFGTGFKMIMSYEGNSEFNTLSYNVHKCNECSKDDGMEQLSWECSCGHKNIIPYDTIKLNCDKCGKVRKFDIMGKDK